MKEIARTRLGARYQFSDVECRQLLEHAKQALKTTFPVAGQGGGAAVLAPSGQIYTGGSYISETYTLSMHAEMVAITNATAHGEPQVLAITGPNCHMCKQLIYENALHSGVDITIIYEEEGALKQTAISELMPQAWPAK